MYMPRLPCSRLAWLLGCLLACLVGQGNRVQPLISPRLTGNPNGSGAAWGMGTDSVRHPSVVHVQGKETLPSSAAHIPPPPHAKGNPGWYPSDGLNQHQSQNQWLTGHYRYSLALA